MPARQGWYVGPGAIRVVGAADARVDHDMGAVGEVLGPGYR
ncbi:hypothetical protein [Rhodococcus opacus]